MARRAHGWCANQGVGGKSTNIICFFFSKEKREQDLKYIHRSLPPFLSCAAQGGEHGATRRVERVQHTSRVRAVPPHGLLATHGKRLQEDGGRMAGTEERECRAFTIE